MLRLVAISFALLTVLTSCSEGKEPELFPASCHLPSPSPGAGARSVPEGMLVVPGTVIRDVTRDRGLLVIALNVPLGVTGTLNAYLEVLKPPRYEEISTENEGFEAESYFSDTETGDFVAVQIRNPGCENAVAAFVSIGRVDSPVGGGASSPAGKTGNKKKD
jgi:hypothetical protein